MIGCVRKLSRMFDPKSGRAVIAPLDHGVGEGMLQGLEDMRKMLELIADFRVQGVVLNKGAARAHMADIPPGMTAVVQLSGGTRHCLPPYARAIVGSVVEAMRLGADMVAVQVNIANEMEDRMLADMGLVIDEAHGYGLPVLAMIQPRGERIVNEMDPSLISHCIRLGAELGADVTGAPYSGDAKSFSRACASSSAPVLVTGGPSRPDFKGFTAMLADALAAGAAGTCIGRNIFQNDDPRSALTRVVELVHGKGAAEDVPARS